MLDGAKFFRRACHRCRQSMRLLLMRAVVLSELPLGKGLPFVAGNLSFHPVYLNDESVWTVKAQEGCSVTVQFLDQK